MRNLFTPHYYHKFQLIFNVVQFFSCCLVCGVVDKLCAVKCSRPSKVHPCRFSTWLGASLSLWSLPMIIPGCSTYFWPAKSTKNSFFDLSPFFLFLVMASGRSVHLSVVGSIGWSVGQWHFSCFLCCFFFSLHLFPSPTKAVSKGRSI